MQKTSAWPLTWVYVCLMVYASLYPFEGWRIQGIAPWGFMWAPWPQYWTVFDVISNVLGYAPLGFFLTLAFRRTWPQLPALALTIVLAALLSGAMETMQFFLPARVPSNVDWLLNVAGACLGGATAALLTWAGVLARWPAGWLAGCHARASYPEVGSLAGCLAGWPARRPVRQQAKQPARQRAAGWLSA